MSDFTLDNGVIKLGVRWYDFEVNDGGVFQCAGSRHIYNGHGYCQCGMTRWLEGNIEPELIGGAVLMGSGES